MRSWRIAVLLHINGLPGAGKTSLADSFVDARPLALAVDIDEIRTRLGQWNEREESKLVARELAVSMIDTHLRNGFDVVVAQFLGRLEFIERLEATAKAAGAEFAEVCLSPDPASAGARFRARRAAMQCGAHPESDVADDDIDEMLASASDALRFVLSRRPAVRTIDATGSTEQILQSLVGLETT